jgi:ABC-type multidrug transport system fused ATPase/permease subunit
MLIGIFVLILLGVGFEALAPYPFKILIDNVLARQEIGRSSLLGRILGIFNAREALAFVVILVFFLSSMLGSICDYFVAIITKKLNRNIINNFAKRAFVNLEQLAVGYYKQNQIGDYIYRLSYDVNALGDFMEHGLIPIVTNLVYLATTITIMFLISIKLAFIALAIMPPLALSLFIFNRRLGKASTRSERTNSALFGYIQEVLSQLKIVQAFNQEKRSAQTFEVNQQASLHEELNVAGLDLMLNLMIGVIIAVGYSIVIAYGINAVFLGSLSTGLLIVFIFYIDNLTNPLLSLLTGATRLKENYVKISRLGEFFSTDAQIHDTGEIFDIQETEIEFNDVTVLGGDTKILDHVSFRIPARKTTVIVGVSGSGKTTIASLILRFIDQNSGKIRLGNNDIKSYSIKSLRDIISYVPQEIVLFNDTIKHNIAFGNPKASMGEIKKAATAAVADSFISRQPHGYDTVAGESGSNISGGQRQRIMLARAFLKKDARILIFDEPISALDIKTRELLMANLVKFTAGKTTIIISNILESIKQADHVILINEGRILHSGGSEALLQESKLASLILHSR